MVSVMSFLAHVLCILLGFLCSHVGNAEFVDMDVELSQLPIQPINSIDRKFVGNSGKRVAAISNRTLSFSVSIDTKSAIHIVDSRFLSTGIGVKSVTTKSAEFDPKSTIQQTLLQGLSPAVFRVGGRSADETIFTVNTSDSTRFIPVSRFLTGEQWKNLNEFTKQAGVDLAFAFNVLLRKGNSWDPSNARKLLDFNAHHGYQVIWQLGNEPDLFRKNYDTKLSAAQLARDFIKLRSILSEARFRYSNELVGPDVTHLSINKCASKASKFSALSSTSAGFLKRFLHHIGGSDVINATTLHFYNLHSSYDVDNFTDPDVLDRTRCELQKFREMINEYMTEGFRVKWLGESSSVSGGRGDGLHNYASGFLMLHNLGVAAEMGVSIFVYWNFIGGSYSLLRGFQDVRNPTPLYWAFFLHKRLLGTQVLSVTYTWDGRAEEGLAHEKNQSHVYVFAHCTKESPMYHAGAITLMALNMNNASEVSLNLTGNLSNKHIDEYLLTPYGNSSGGNVSLNGDMLQMKNSTHFPDIIPRHLPAGSPILLPPRTYGFFVIRDADALVCLGKKESIRKESRRNNAMTEITTLERGVRWKYDLLT